MSIKQTLLNIYDKRYKELMIISVVVLLLAIGVLISNYARTGEFVQKGVTLKGGITLTIPADKEIDLELLEEKISEAVPKADIGTRKLTEAGAIKAIVIEATDVEEEELVSAVKGTEIIDIKEDEYTLESMGSSLGQSFFRQTIGAVIVAFIAMGFVVLITFRALVPSLFVILAATSDIVCTLAAVSLLGIKLSTAGVAAFLMLIGYSVDTDILLTTRVLKRKEGTIFERIMGSMKTGMTMSMTSLLAAIVAYVFSTSDVIKQIMAIIIIGLAFDMLFTWIQNTGILRWHLERKAKKEGKHE